MSFDLKLHSAKESRSIADEQTNKHKIEETAFASLVNLNARTGETRTIYQQNLSDNLYNQITGLGYYDKLNVDDETPQHLITLSENGKQPDIPFYTITYDLDGGTLINFNPSSYYFGTELTLNNPTKTGYTFIGWTGSNGITPELTVVITEDTSGNLEYKANYNAIDYILTIDLNDETEPTKVTLHYKDNYSLSIPKKAGHKFIQWNMTNSDASISNNVFTMGTQDTIITAEWYTPAYDIEYDLDGGILETENPYAYIYGDTFTLNNPKKSGYTFSGWTGSNGDEPQLKVTISPISEGNLFYKANYTINPYTLTIDNDNGSDNQTVSLRYGETYDLTIPIKTGCSFDKWIISNDSSSIKDSIFTMGTEDTTITASYTYNEYTTTFDPGLGSVDITSIKAKYTSEQILPTPVRDSYLFKGWYTSSEDGTRIGGAGNTYIQEPNDVTYYAQWAVKTTIKGYVTNGINGDPLKNVSIKFREGSNNQSGDYLTTDPANVHTDKNGYYEIYFYDGSYTCELSLDGFVTAYLNITIPSTTNEYHSSLSPVLDKTATRSITSWTANPKDIDLHVKGIVDGEEFHCYYGNKNVKVGDSSFALDTDARQGYGPETITVKIGPNTKQFSYTYYAYSYTSGYDMKNVDCTITVYSGDTQIGTFNSLNSTGSGRTWTICTITQDGYEIINKITS